jgi:hypothetical protein
MTRGVKSMATRQLFGRAASAAPADSGRKAAGYCCVFLAGCYVAAVVVLVAYLIVLAFR